MLYITSPELIHLIIDCLYPRLGRSPGKGNDNPLAAVFLPGKSHGLRSLVGYSPWGHKESDMTEVS